MIRRWDRCFAQQSSLGLPSVSVLSLLEHTDAGPCHATRPLTQHHEGVYVAMVWLGGDGDEPSRANGNERYTSLLS